MKLEVLVGMIGSGKSSYALRRADEGALVVCHDELTQMLHGGAYRYEQGLRGCYRQMEERLAACALYEGRDVVIDRTHLTRESRKRWLDFRRERVAVMNSFRDDPAPVELSIVAVAFPISSPEDHAMRRYLGGHRGRSHAEWLRVARHHAAQADAEPLSDDEGFDEIIRYK